MLEVKRVDHIGIRVRELDAAIAFYEVLGFSLLSRSSDDAVVVLKNPNDVEINLIYNANAGDRDKNILMDIPEKYPGYTHVALNVASIAGTIEALHDNDIQITQGPVSFGLDGHVSVFCRDPDRNVIELRGRSEDLSALGAQAYVPEN